MRALKPLVPVPFPDHDLGAVWPVPSAASHRLDGAIATNAAPPGALIRSFVPHAPETWTPELLAYAAGVIDSDGSIGIRLDTYAMRVRKVKTGPIYKERVTLRQIEPGAVDLFHRAFGGSRFITAGRENAQPLHRIKRRHAELCVELRRLKDESRRARFAYGRGHVGGGPRPDALSAAMGELRAEILCLNRVEGRFDRYAMAPTPEPRETVPQG